MILEVPQKGHLLIAEPALTGDTSFSRSVVLLASYNQKGSVGFILNKPLDYRLNELVQEIDQPFPIFNGGPVEQDALYFIHRVPHLVENSLEISDGVYWGGNFTQIIQHINQGELKHDDIRFFLGYSGWHRKQVEQELAHKSWVLVENDHKDALLDHPVDNMWQEKMVLLGGQYLLWTHTPEDPTYN